MTIHSRTFTKPEKNYSQIEAESLGVLYGITRNKLYLYGLPHFVVETDHKPLVTLYGETRKNCPPRIERHKLNLQGYNYKLIWRPGKEGDSKNPGPILNDFASRHPAPSRNMEEITELTENYVNNQIYLENEMTALDIQKISEATNQDTTIKLLRKAINRGYIEKSEKQDLK